MCRANETYYVDGFSYYSSNFKNRYKLNSSIIFCVLENCTNEPIEFKQDISYFKYSQKI